MERPIHHGVGILLIAAVGFACSTDDESSSDGAERPYAGWQERGVASLSEDDIEELLEGAGHGYALSAELNGYPGPAHVLDLATELELADAELGDIQAIHADMETAARELGEQLIVAEFELDEAFRAGTDPEETLELTERSAAIEAQLRATHLEAHLVTTALLDDEQIRRYDHLRGYADGHDGDGHDGDDHDNDGHGADGEHGHD